GARAGPAMRLDDDVLRHVERLGLDLARGGAKGRIDDRAVRLELSPVSKAVHCRAWALLEPPLDLGLDLHRRALALGYMPGVPTGSADIDAEYWVQGDEPPRLASLFAPELVAALVAADRRGAGIVLTDRGVGVAADLVGDARRALDRAFDAALHIAARLDAARAAVPCASAVARHAASVERLAEARSLAFLRAPLSATGALDGRRVELVATRAARWHHHFVVGVRFARALDLDVSLRRQGFLDGLGALVGRDDIAVGDEAFDRRFLLRGRRGAEPRIVGLFDAEARGALLDIDERFGPVFVDDAGLAVRPVPVAVEPDGLAALVDLASDAAGRLERRAAHPEAGGPYR
ncbi:MAG TPA: hypothetical protein VHB21_19755, partial [Minicystis sp.]|nr:hypothetical protein [Minicystis sp.]